ncbi:hypothetical protein [Chryseobacterium jejuense]|uniref:hypothetical protein n=1 Tax=Chryseobacterium jejuense TaxID=445960 RepID=UPI001AE1447D|nr:hypothetical protein [Chryseobacterium jejuense]MBP2617188.1 hypothetical protein [Chryseobacterium jejuense]
MIQFILMLLGIMPSNDKANTVAPNNSALIATQSLVNNISESTEDTSGDNGQLPPKK